MQNKVSQIYLSRPGILCCAGDSPDAFFDAALRGSQHGIKPVTADRVGPSSEGRNFLAGRIAEGDLPDISHEVPKNRSFRIAAAALEQIRGTVEQVRSACGSERIGVCAGSCDNGSEASFLAHKAYYAGGAFPADYDLRFQGASFTAEYIAHALGVSGPAFTVAAACASSAASIIKGAQLIKAGLCDAVIVGGTDIASETVLLGFSALEAVSDGVSNPFSKNRKGITLGEGAAFFVLSREPLKGDGSGIELLGYGESADAFHMTAPRADGSGAVRAMREALSNAGKKPDDIDYVNLHGTGTPLNDSMEALALAAVFPASAPLVSSTKPVTGHTLGAAGALELALCWMALDAASKNAEGKGKVPLHCWDGVSDGELPPLHLVGKEDGAQKLRICMSNSFAFGGCNVSLVIGAAGG
ncbi:beta-ketoacyl-[acyl-carrier-protein] synthase II [Spirochaetia bacterium]|nr:beta-ketoacyl-[acyl-carrier-protein] synthase II [Spirochaetia bacterium]